MEQFISPTRFFTSSDSDLDSSNSFSALSDLEDSTLDESVYEENPEQRRRRPVLKIMDMYCNSLVPDNRHALSANILEKYKLDVICVCESKLDPTINDSAVLPKDSGYGIVSRKDNWLGAGGELIAVKYIVVVSHRRKLPPDGISPG